MASEKATYGTSIENLVKFRLVVIEICERTQTDRQTCIHTYRQTNTLIAILLTHANDEVIISYHLRRLTRNVNEML